MVPGDPYLYSSLCTCLILLSTTVLRHPYLSFAPTSVFMTLAVYFSAAIFYNRVVLGLKGRESLPRLNFSWLTSLKSLFSCGFLRRRNADQSEPTWGSWQRGGQRGFSRLPTDEEEAMLGGDNRRFSIEEEDEGARDNPILSSGVPPAHEGAIRL